MSSGQYSLIIIMSYSCLYIVDEMMIMCCVFLQVEDNALHVAADNGQYDVANLLLQKRPGLINHTNVVSEQIIQLLYSK